MFNNLEDKIATSIDTELSCDFVTLYIFGFGVDWDNKESEWTCWGKRGDF